MWRHCRYVGTNCAKQRVATCCSLFYETFTEVKHDGNRTPHVWMSLLRSGCRRLGDCGTAAPSRRQQDSLLIRWRKGSCSRLYTGDWKTVNVCFFRDIQNVCNCTHGRARYSFRMSSFYERNMHCAYAAKRSTVLKIFYLLASRTGTPWRCKKCRHLIDFLRGTTP